MKKKCGLVIVVLGLAIATFATGWMFGRSEIFRPYSTVDVLGSRAMFMGGIITPSPGSGEFLVLIDGTPAEDRDGDKVADLLRAGHRVSLRLREEADQPPIVVSDITKDGEFIIRCHTPEEANHVMDRLHTWPVQR